MSAAANHNGRLDAEDRALFDLLVGRVGGGAFRRADSAVVLPLGGGMRLVLLLGSLRLQVAGPAGSFDASGYPDQVRAARQRLIALADRP